MHLLLVGSFFEGYRDVSIEFRWSASGALFGAGRIHGGRNLWGAHIRVTHASPGNPALAVLSQP